MMFRKLVLVLLFAMVSTTHAQAQVESGADDSERVFQIVDEGSEDSDALVMGRYALAPDVTKKLMQVDTLEKAIAKIRYTEWKSEPWTKKNAELTIRQRMDDYIQTARDFYSGNGKRSQGVVGKRLEKYTDTELGDRQLSNALVSVQMAAAWNVPLQSGQADRLDTLLRLRLQSIKDVTTR